MGDGDYEQGYEEGESSGYADWTMALSEFTDTMAGVEGPSEAAQRIAALERVVEAAREFLRAEYEVRGLSVIMARRVHLIEALEALDANDTPPVEPKEAE